VPSSLPFLLAFAQDGQRVVQLSRRHEQIALIDLYQQRPCVLRGIDTYLGKPESPCTDPPGLPAPDAIERGFGGARQAKRRDAPGPGWAAQGLILPQQKNCHILIV